MLAKNLFFAFLLLQGDKKTPEGRETGALQEVINLKRIINGKKYNTDTAEFLADYQIAYRSDFNFCREELYKKRTGEYFLFGEGGANSKYRKSVGLNEWGGGKRITPLTEDEAKRWVEVNANESYEEIFGEVEE